MPQKTMTVSELRRTLEKYPPNLPICATWEGVHAPIKQDSISCVMLSKFNGNDLPKLTLVLDVEEY